MYAYFALNEYNVMPWDFTELPRRKKASLIGMIKARIEKEKNRPAQPKGGKGSGTRRR